MNPELLPEQFTFSTFMVWAIDSLKKSNWFPWLDENTEKLNKIAAVVAAGITAVSIHFVMEPGAVDLKHVVIQLSMSIDGLWHFIKGFAIAIASQQTILKAYQITNTLRDIAKHLGHTESKTGIQ